ncbi:lysine exporter LysO family protein [Hydrogenophaga sp. RWCD_12]|uniref:lysine exporter LysO family protein n=1 Tax=Hydrogenophaga sp. RWCD_12 TaxID=3391190 RepID=UPI003984C826
MLFIFQSLWPIGLALLLGIGIGRIAPQLARKTGHALKVLIFLLLFYCGREFSAILQVGPTLGRIVSTSAIFALLTTAGSWGLMIMFLKQQGALAVSPGQALALQSWRRAGADCLVALGTVTAGVVAGQHDLPLVGLIGTHHLIHVMVLLIGVELVEVPLARTWRDPSAWAVPLLVMGGSALGGLGAAWWTGESARVALAIASGFGWVTLSSVLVGNALGDEYGAITMVTDMLRELMAITALYLFGARFSRQSIGLCGATALDATLPLIRAQCGTGFVPLALLSGLVLTLASPVFIVLLLGAGR